MRYKQDLGKMRGRKNQRQGKLIKINKQRCIWLETSMQEAEESDGHEGRGRVQEEGKGYGDKRLLPPSRPWEKS